MEMALGSLRSSVDEKEFLRLTRTALRLVQNVLNEPAQEKYRKIRAASKVRSYVLISLAALEHAFCMLAEYCKIDYV